MTAFCSKRVVGPLFLLLFSARLIGEAVADEM